MHFDEDRLFSDPTYAPGLNKSKDSFYWRAPKRYADLKIKPVLLRGDESERAQMCRELTRELIAKYEGTERKIVPGTWSWLFGRYKGDQHSPFQRVKGNTRLIYGQCLARWEAAIADAFLSEADYAQIMDWRAAMEENGRTRSYIKRQFTMLRMVVRYGAAIGDSESKRLRDIFSATQMRGLKTARRKEYITRAQVEAFVTAADAAKHPMMGTGIMLQFELALRGVDVRGQWLKAKPGDTGGIIHQGLRWQDGLTWDMISKDVTRIAKVISKSASSSPEPMVFDLDHIPALQARLMAVPAEKRVGAVIVTPEGRPYLVRHWTSLFRKIATKAGIPPEIQTRDTRSGAATEAELAGVNLGAIQKMLGHADQGTTQGYTRGDVILLGQVTRARQVGTNKGQT